jgi:hypothetical protein
MNRVRGMVFNAAVNITLAMSSQPVLLEEETCEQITHIAWGINLSVE